MAEPRKPQDHKKKAEKADPVFSFEHNGETYTFDRATDEVLTPGFVRRNRDADMADLAYQLIESVAGSEALDVLDNMSFKEHGKVLKAYQDHILEVMGAELGE